MCNYAVNSITFSSRNSKLLKELHKKVLACYDAMSDGKNLVKDLLKAHGYIVPFRVKTMLAHVMNLSLKRVKYISSAVKPPPLGKITWLPSSSFFQRSIMMKSTFPSAVKNQETISIW